MVEGSLALGMLCVHSAANGLRPNPRSTAPHREGNENVGRTVREQARQGNVPYIMSTVHGRTAAENGLSSEEKKRKKTEQRPGERTSN